MYSALILKSNGKGMYPTQEWQMGQYVAWTLGTKCYGQWIFQWLLLRLLLWNWKQNVHKNNKNSIQNIVYLKRLKHTQYTRTFVGSCRYCTENYVDQPKALWKRAEHTHIEIAFRFLWFSFEP